MKFKVQGSKFRAILLVIIYLLLVTTLGCEAFVRKFTRKTKKKDFSREEMVLVPEEYRGPLMTKEEIYRQYFLYWESWHDELIQALTRNGNHKKQMYCVAETIKNLEQMKSMLDEQTKKKIDIHISGLKELEGQIREDAYGMNVSRSRFSAERIKRNILRHFSYQKIKNYLL